jgi:FtsZ-interacting cell division protein ZipA
MSDEKSKKINISTILLIFAIIGIAIMGFFVYKFYNEKIIESQKVKDLNTELEQIKSDKSILQEKIDAINNALKLNENNVNEETSIDTESKKEKESTENNVNTSAEGSKKVEIQFESMDNAAARGYPEVLKIYEHNETEMDFEYNAGFDLTNSTLKNISGIAKVNNKNAFEYSEEINGHQYKIVFEFDEKKTSVKVTEYDNSNLLSFITLANVTQ